MFQKYPYAFVDDVIVVRFTIPMFEKKSVPFVTYNIFKESEFGNTTSKWII